MPSEIGSSLGKYVLQSRLGQGGMGIVYQATDTRLAREVALKLLPADVARDSEAVQRFLREARAAARLNHPNVVAIHDVDQHEGRCFLVMELVTGGSVQDLLRRGPLSWQEATRMAADACRGLAAAHEAGLIHRDIKPSNLMLAADGSAKLADFGLAKLANDPLGQQPLTRTNTTFGTPDYMAPEQCRGDQLDARCDLYSLGATYYAMLTGQPPFPLGEPMQVMFAHCSQATPDPRGRNPLVPSACAEIVLKALAKNRSDRYPSAREMLAALQEALASGPTGRHGDATLAAPPIAVPPPPPPPPPPQAAPPHARPLPADSPAPLWMSLAAGVLALGLLLVGWWAWQLMAGQTPRPSDSPIAPLPTSDKSLAVGAAPAASFPAIRGDVRGVAISADESRLFSAGGEGSLAEWDLARRQSAREYRGASPPLRAVATAGSLLVAGGDAKTLWIWKIGDERPQESIADFEGEISALAFSPDGKRLAVGTYGELRLYSVAGESLRLIKTLGTSNTGEVKCYMVKGAAFSSDSRWLAATTWGEKGAAIWDAATGELRAVQRSQFDEPIAAVFVPGGSALVFGSIRQGICLWDWERKAVPRPLAEAADRSLRSLVILPGNRALATVGEWGGQIDVYELASGRRSQSIAAHTQAAALGVAVMTRKRQLVTWGGNENQATGLIQLWPLVEEAQR